MRSLALFAALSLLHGSSLAASSDPWQRLGALRDALADAAPVAAPFSQTFFPVGFVSGDTESGVLLLGLPDCARWDYDDPFPKSFLLCGDIAWAWNPGEMSGRRYQVSPDEEQSLDLLRLEVDELRQRFEAESGASDGFVEIRLEPTEATSLISTATLTLTGEGNRLTAMTFIDREGNRTVFELGPLESTDTQDAFDPPALEWLED